MMSQSPISPPDLLAVLIHFLSLSAVSIGGAITTVPDMHRYLVSEKGFLDETQFSASIALAQAAPGPNILFVALLGWNMGLNGGSNSLGILTGCVSMVGILLPSTTLSYTIGRAIRTRRSAPLVQAFMAGMAPVIVGLMISTSWTIASTIRGSGRWEWLGWLVFIVAASLLYAARVRAIWVLVLGALFGTCFLQRVP